MRKVFVIIALLSLSASSLALGRTSITPDLSRVLEEASPVELIRVNIALADQIDRGRLENLVAGMSRVERREVVVRELKEFAARDQAEVLQYLREMEAQGEVARIHSLWVNNMVSCKATPRVIRNLAAIPGIRSMDWDEARPVLATAKALSPKRAARTLAWGIVKIRAPEVWALGNTGQGILASVHDTGVDYNHTDLQDHMWDGGPAYPNHGWDFNGNDDDPMDDYGHGTHCAGTIAGDGTAGCTTGVAPDATIMALKVLDSSGWGNESDVWLSIQFAMDNGVDVMSFSIGWLHSWNPDRHGWRTTFENALTAGLIASVAAGNERQWGDPAPDNVRCPGDVPPPWLHPDQTLTGGLCDVVTAGATNSGDNYANFSSYGPVTWEMEDPWYDYPYQPEMGLIDPDVAAPGVDVTSCQWGGGYTEMSGTSMATPHVAGAMCLILTAHPGWLPSEVDEALELTALDLGPVGKDTDYGAGRIDAFEAVNYGGATAPNIYMMHYLIDDPPPGNQNGALDPGETADLAVTLRNIGLDATNVVGVLRESDPYVTLGDSLSNFGNMAQGDSANNSTDPFALTADPSTPAGYMAACTLHISEDGGYQVDRPINLMIGDPTTSPGGPDPYGYYCYDDTDVGWTECPTYNWVEISGIGTELLLDDDQTVTLPLPFTFKYYGVDYSQISICSNGFQAMGVTSGDEYSNEPLPSPNLPPAGICPFWDDLISAYGGGGGTVYYHHDDINHTYIVEYYQMHHYPSGDPETFEILFYDPVYDTTITGDGEIICQYNSLSNPNSCTIGIQDHSQTIALQYVYDGNYEPHAPPLQPGRAIKFTTDPPVVGVEEVQEARTQRQEARLLQNYPNPFSHSTSIPFRVQRSRGAEGQGSSLSTYERINLSIYDLSGRLVRTLVDEALTTDQSALTTAVSWDGRDEAGEEVSSGVYLYRLSAGDFSSTRKMVVLR